MLRRTESTDMMTLLASLHYAGSHADIAQICDRMKKLVGLTGLLLQRVRHRDELPVQGVMMGFGSYLPFCMEYRAGNMLSQDPLIRDAILRDGESGWNSYRQPTPSSQQWRLHDRYGLRSGICFIDQSIKQADHYLVVRVAGTGSRISPAQQDFFDQVTPYLTRVIDRDWFKASPDISVRQLEIARQLKDGRSTRQIAAALHIPVRAVRHHMSRLANELGFSAERSMPTSEDLLKALASWSAL